MAPGVDPALQEIEARLAQIGRMIGGAQPESWPRDIGSLTDGAAPESLTHFDRAALQIFLDLIDRCDRLSRRVFGTVADIRGFGPKSTPVSKPRQPGPSSLDPDRLASAFRTFVALWMILLACMLVPDMPMPPGVVPMVAAAAIQLSVFPHLSLRAVVGPGLGATALAWLFHVFAMPHLHSYLGLGIGIFLVIFFVMLLMAKPQHDLGRPIVTSFFVMVIGVQNEQSYNALFPMNYGISFSFALAAIWLAGLFPVSFNPQPAFLGRLERFFAGCRRLVAAVPQPGKKPDRSYALDLVVTAVRDLPGKIRPWLGRQPAVAEDRVKIGQLQGFADGLDMLSSGVRHLVELRELPQSAVLRTALGEDVRKWRLGVEDILRQLEADPAEVDARSLRGRLEAMLDTLSTRIEETMNSLPEDAITSQERRNMYRLLGGYRAMSEALVVVAERANDLDWNEIREARF